MRNLILKNGLVISPEDNLEAKKDIKIENGKIVAIEDEIFPQEGFAIRDIEGLCVSAGFVEMHCHLRVPNGDAKETIETGIASALAGGYTAICPMANTSPAIDNPIILNYVKEKVKNTSEIGYHQICAITKNLDGETLVDFKSLLDNGAIAFSDDGKPIENMNLLKSVFEYAASVDVLVILHSEDSALAKGGVINEGAISSKLGLKGISNLAESVAIARELEVLRYVPNARVHFSHISTKRSVELIRQAKKDGLNVTAETAPHYFSLTDEDIVPYDARFKMNPPLRSVEDKQAIIEGIQDGTIDVIATDHAPHTVKEKTDLIQAAPMGIVGFETAFGLTLTNLVNKGYISLSKAISLLTCNPAKILKLKDQGSLSLGNISNLSVLNVNRKWTVEAKNFKSKCKISPFEGMELTGKPEFVVINGKIYE